MGEQLHQLLSAAVNALENANFLLREQQHDAAFNFYLDAYEIAVNIIPSHEEYAFTARTDATWKSQFAEVLAIIRSMESSMREVKQTLDDQAASAPPPIPEQPAAQQSGQRLVSITARDTAAELELMRNSPDARTNNQEPSPSPMTQESSPHRPLPTPPSSSPDKRLPRKPVGSAPSPPKHAPPLPPPPPIPEDAPPLPPPAYSPPAPPTQSASQNQEQTSQTQARAQAHPQSSMESQLQALSLSDQRQPPPDTSSPSPAAPVPATSSAPDPLAARFAELRNSHGQNYRSQEYFEAIKHNSATKQQPQHAPSISDATASELKLPKQRPMTSSSASSPASFIALANSANGYAPATASTTSLPGYATSALASASASQQQPVYRPLHQRSMLFNQNMNHVLSPSGSNSSGSTRPLSLANLPRSPPSAYSPVVSSISTNPFPNPPKARNDYSNRMYASKQLWPGGGSDEMFVDGGYRTYAPSPPSGTSTPPSAQPKQPKIPFMTSLKPSTLVKYMREFAVLLIDVRERERFDNGHIFSNNVICIEPIELQSNTSADELEERLIYSPPIESDMFSRRNHFDIVVYYDQSTANTEFLAGSPADCAQPHLRALYDSLYSFSRDKPLKDGLPPVLLAGGLDAWIGFMGPQALTVTNTAAASGKSAANRKSQNGAITEIKRNPTINANASWEVRKRRLHGYRALSREESLRWAEKAREEELKSITPEDTVPEETGEEDGNAGVTTTSAAGDANKQNNYAHSYNDFFRRYPEPQHIKQQSMVSSPPNAAPGWYMSTSSGAAISPIPPPVPQHTTPMPPSRPRPAAPRTSYSGVSDNGRVQPPLARQASASRTAVFAASSPIDRLPLPRTGLPNLGNTCYMNSILQCLSGTLPLTRYFITDQFRELSKDQEQNFQGSHGLLPEFYANLIRMLWRADRSYGPLYTLREFCGRIHPEFRTTRQQDAKEFFDILVDSLHVDFNDKWRAKQLPELTEEEETRREQMPLSKVSNIEWARYTHNESSLITFLFAGQHASRLECLTCHNTSTKCEAFYTISVEIPQAGAGHIYDCLNSYCAAERLEWKCKRCGDKTRDTSKRIILTRAPRILVFHFKRFSTTWTGSTQKIHTPINFPLTHLDMTPYMLNNRKPPPQFPSNGSSTTSQGSPRSFVPGAEANELAVTPPYLYNAYAVVRHIGSSPTEGHYIALVKDSRANIWRRFDDDRVYDFKPANSGKDCIQNEQAYLVFYERVLV